MSWAQRRARLLWISWLALSCFLVSLRASAQPTLELRLGAREVEAGEAIVVELTAMSSGDGRPSDPRLEVAAGLQASAPQIGTRQSVSITGFSMVKQVGISATWRVVASAPGSYVVGPATVRVGGELFQTSSQTLTVVPPGQLTRRRRTRPSSPFGGFSPFDDFFDRARRGPSYEDAPPRLVVERPPDPTAFVRAVLSQRRAVVGEQITLSIYAYGARGTFQEAPGSREASYPDFLAHRLVEEPSQQPVYTFRSAGRQWLVVKVREVALFPLRAGELFIGPMKFGFLGRSYGTRGALGLPRSTRELSVLVREPPAAGRVAGFDGEVGSFRLEATVEPREVAAGGAVAVRITATGSGRLPSGIKLPEQAGVAWDEPTIVDDVRVLSEERLGGQRVFNHVVRLERPGDFDLGEVRLPFYDPETRRYSVARAELGRVIVTQAPVAASGPSEPHAPELSSLVAMRVGALGPMPTRDRFGDGPLFWLILLGAPAVVVLAWAASAILSRLLRARRQRVASTDALVAQALEDARRAGTETQAVLADLERAVYLAVEGCTGVKARAVLRAQLASVLTRAEMHPDRAEEVVQLLGRFEQIRFSGSPLQGSLVREVEALCRKLRGGRRPGAKAASAAALLCALLWAQPSPLLAQPPLPSEQELQKVADQVAEGAFTVAIDQLELWSDQGRVHRDLSFDRGVAYLARAESTAAKPTDYGQAAAAFQEAAHLDSTDEESAQLAERVRTLISERLAKDRGTKITARPRLLRALSDLVGEGGWAAIGAVGSGLLSLGLLAWWLLGATVSRVVSALICFFGAVSLALGGGMTAVALHLRESYHPAVVIVEQGRLLSSAGGRLPVSRAVSTRADLGDQVPQGALVYVAETVGRLSRVEWGDREAWIDSRQLRRLAER